MRSSLLIGLAAAAGLANAAAVAADGFTLKAPPKIAVLYFDAKNDGGWTQAMHEARLRMETALGQQIAYVEKIPENASVIIPAGEKFIQRGYNIILGNAYGHSAGFKELSEKYPISRS
jgi:basic membrane lipoprotein Med (substrate-binding protein (PBP1-ABC) superfamily)